MGGRFDSIKVDAALAFVEQHGVVLVSAKGSAPRLIDAIAGESIAGNWWSHPQAREIYHVLSRVTESEQVVVCRLIDGKITLVHRRLWPALVRLSDRFSPRQLARVDEQHTPSGRHTVRETPYPAWVPDDVVQQADALSEAQANALLGRWFGRRGVRRTTSK